MKKSHFVAFHKCMWKSASAQVEAAMGQLRLTQKTNHACIRRDNEEGNFPTPLPPPYIYICVYVAQQRHTQNHKYAFSIAHESLD